MQRPALVGLFVLLAAAQAGAVSVRAARPNIAHSPARRSASVLPHVVVIVQENRSFDNLFNGYPGANTVSVDPYTGAALQPISLAKGGAQPNHDHGSAQDNGGFVRECAAPSGSTTCAMTGFSTEGIRGCTKGSAGCTAFAYVTQSEVAPYWSLAQQGELLDDMFQCNQGPSFPAHQCLIAGQAGGFLSNGSVNPLEPYAWAENVNNPTCANFRGEGLQVDVNGRYPGTESNGYLCSSYQTIFDEVTAAGMSWRYYLDSTTSLWSGPENVAQDYKSKSIIAPDYQFFSDLRSGTLANLTYIMPDTDWSDHPGYNVASWAGTDWVANLINAIEVSQFASTTEILVLWDDWGGWYDHVVPPITAVNSFGFRVPGFIIGPGVEPRVVDHSEHNQSSFVLGTVEYLLGLPSLDQEDGQMARFENFDFVKYPGAPAYQPVPVHSPSSWYGSKKHKVITDLDG